MSLKGHSKLSLKHHENQVSKDWKRANVTHIQDGQEGIFRELQVGQSHLSAWEDNGETDLGNQFLHTCRTRQSEIPNMDLQRGKHA